MEVTETAELLYRDEVLRARAMASEEKLCAGAELFEMACQITLAGIRYQFPGISECDALGLLKQRLAARRRSDANEWT